MKKTSTFPPLSFFPNILPYLPPLQQYFQKHHFNLLYIHSEFTTTQYSSTSKKYKDHRIIFKLDYKQGIRMVIISQSDHFIPTILFWYSVLAATYHRKYMIFILQHWLFSLSIMLSSCSHVIGLDGISSLFVTE